MNKDDVIRMALEAEIIDFRDASDDPHVVQMVEFLERFSALVAAAEREACAQLCEQSDRYRGSYFAQKIRERGE